MSKWKRRESKILCQDCKGKSVRDCLSCCQIDFPISYALCCFLCWSCRKNDSEFGSRECIPLLKRLIILFFVLSYFTLFIGIFYFFGNIFLTLGEEYH